MRVARIRAQAKVNLILRVGPMATSGFHDLATLFQRIDLGDEVVIRVGGNVRMLDVQGPRVPPGGLGPPERNLAFRAADAYAKRTGWPMGFAIELTKHVPVGAGLGGGSADAGAVLRALDAMAPQPIGALALAELATTLGSDVPFLASDSVTALGLGRGDRISALGPLEQRDVLLAVPEFSIATADAYRWFDEASAGSPPRAPHSLIDFGDAMSWTAVAAASHNDFERVVESRHPLLGVIREDLLRCGAHIARLSGSGSTVFGIFEKDGPQLARITTAAEIVATRTSTQVVQVEVLE